MNQPTFLPRRTFLKGVGTAMALPVLDAMLPNELPAADSGSQAMPIRMAYVFFPNGAIMPDWKSKGSDQKRVQSRPPPLQNRGEGYLK